MTPATNLSPMIVGTKAALAQGKKRLQKIPVVNYPMASRRPKKRREDRTESNKEETSSKLNEIVDVMKESASHLVGCSRTVVQDPREQERVSLFQWMLEFTSRMPRQDWREFKKQAISLAMAFTPADSPQANPSRPRISQGSSASSHAHHAQHPMDPPARPPHAASGGYLEMLQSQPTQMVSNFLLSFFISVPM